MTVERRAARVVLVAEGSVLLLNGCDPARPEDGSWWLTPGGGVVDDESLAAAAAREVYEETGLQVSPADLGPVVAERVAHFGFDGRRFRQQEWFFALHVPRFTPEAMGWEEVEHRSLLGYRWWTLDDLASTQEKVYPRELADLLQAVLDGPIAQPMQLSGQ